jgi:hypothetical protein
MFGVAQGGRGVVLTLFQGSQRAKAYVSGVDELEAMLLELIQTLSSSSEDLLAAFSIEVE